MSGETTNVAVAAPQLSHARTWKIAFCLLAIFLCGALMGGLVAVRVVRRAAMRRANPGNWPSLILSRLDRRLKLTPDQHRALEPLVRAAAAEAFEIHQRALTEMGGVVRRTQTKAAPDLSSDQQRRLDDFIRERAALIQRRASLLLPLTRTVPDQSSPAPSPLAARDVNRAVSWP